MKRLSWKRVLFVVFLIFAAPPLSWIALVILVYASDDFFYVLELGEAERKPVEISEDDIITQRISFDRDTLRDIKAPNGTLISKE